MRKLDRLLKAMSDAVGARYWDDYALEGRKVVSLLDIQVICCHCQQPHILYMIESVWSEVVQVRNENSPQSTQPAPPLNHSPDVDQMKPKILCQRSKMPSWVKSPICPMQMRLHPSKTHITLHEVTTRTRTVVKHSSSDDEWLSPLKAIESQCQNSMQFHQMTRKEFDYG